VAAESNCKAAAESNRKAAAGENPLVQWFYSPKVDLPKDVRDSVTVSPRVSFHMYMHSTRVDVVIVLRT
jgi:hypothetical protein